jgi:hypothetical protein
MNPRVLKSEIEKIKATDAGQETDITALETAIGEVPTGEGNDLQSQITALEARVKALEDADTTGDT